jgi:hypothetical protein
MLCQCIEKRKFVAKDGVSICCTDGANKQDA